MKKLILMSLACIFCIAATPFTASAENYEFASGPDSSAVFGKPTSSDELVRADPTSQNLRRNKDAALLPPPYFYGSGNIPTEPSSLYHDHMSGSQPGNWNWTADSTAGGSNAGLKASTSYNNPSAPGFAVSTSTIYDNKQTKYYKDGTIGTLYVARTGKTIKVYEGESLDNLKKGAGHFTATSAWDGNVALCGHNRGSSAYFSFVKDLKTGDKITYTTPYGKRVYKVFDREKIGEYDHSRLGWSTENILTLITCVADTPAQRWAVQCKEV